MKQKLFTLLTLLVLCVTGAWADETYYLQTPEAATPALTGDFYTTATLDQSQSCTYDEVDYSKAIKLGGSVTSASSNNYPDRMIRYDCKTTQTEFTFVVYNTKTSASKYYISSVKENTLGSANTVSDFTSYDASDTKGVYYNTTAYSVTCTSATRASVYFTVGSNNLYVVQIIATEKGENLLTPGTAGYSVNFNKGRIVARSGAATTLDNYLEIHQNQNYAAGSTTSAKMQTNNTNYIKFAVATPMVLNLTTSSTTQYTVSTTKGSEADKITPTANTAKKIKLTSAGTYYINPQGSNVTPTGMSFSAAPVVTYNNNGGTGSMDNSYFTVSACTFTAPTGQEFQEWNTESDGTGDSYEAGDEVESNTTLYAIWYTPAAKHHVTYNLNGGTGTIPTQDDVEEGQTFEVASGTTGITAPDGQRFKTWNDGTNDYAPGDLYTMSTSDVTLTAQWENIYAITEGTHTNGYITIDKETAAEGETITLTATGKPGYSLVTWNVYKTGTPATTVTVTSNQFTMPAYAVTVEATFNRTDSKKQVLYVTTNGSVNGDDQLYKALEEDYTITRAKYDASKIVTDYDLVVLHESIAGTNYNTGLVKAAKEADVPVLNTKVYFYSTGRWGWGTPNAGTSVTGATWNTKYSNIASHPIFEGVTVSDGFFTMFSSAQAKAMQPVELSANGYGYVLATTPAKSPDTGTTCIHEMTAAQRGLDGGATSKYLMISIGNENGCFELLTANGKKLLKNAAAYLMSDDNWTPADEAISTTTGKNYATYVTTNALDFSSVSDDIKAYVAANEASDGKITFTGKDAVPAGTPLLIKTTTPGATVNVPVAASAPAAVGTNKLVAGTGAAINYTDNGKYNYILTNGQFKAANASPVAVGKAYLALDAAAAANELIISFDDEAGDVTGISEIEKMRNGENEAFFNLAGQRVAQPAKGLYIVNGKKVVLK